jgi:hypothetical protein
MFVRAGSKCVCGALVYVCGVCAFVLTLGRRSSDVRHIVIVIELGLEFVIVKLVQTLSIKHR